MGSFCFFSPMLIFQAWSCQQGLVNTTAKLPASPFTFPDMSRSIFLIQSILSQQVRMKTMEHSLQMNEWLPTNARVWWKVTWVKKFWDAGWQEKGKDLTKRLGQLSIRVPSWIAFWWDKLPNFWVISQMALFSLAHLLTFFFLKSFCFCF